MHSYGRDLVVLGRPHARVLRRHGLDAVVPARRYERLLQQADIGAGRESVGAEVENGVCDQLAGPVEGRLSAAEGLDEVGRVVVPQVVLLVPGHGAYFPPAAGVHGVELGGDDVWGGGGEGGWRF